jgi:hypothetical protein
VRNIVSLTGHFPETAVRLAAAVRSMAWQRARALPAAALAVFLPFGELRDPLAGDPA